MMTYPNREAADRQDSGVSDMGNKSAVKLVAGVLSITAVSSLHILAFDAPVIAPTDTCITQTFSPK